MRLAFGGFEGGSALFDGVQAIGSQPGELPVIGAPEGSLHAEAGAPIAGRGSAVATNGYEPYIPLPAGNTFFARVKVRPDQLPPAGEVAYLLKFSHEGFGSRSSAAAGVALRSDGRLIFKHEVPPDGAALPAGVSGLTVGVGQVRMVELGFAVVAATGGLPAHARIELRIDGVPQLVAADFGSPGTASVLYLPEAQAGGRIVYDDFAVNNADGAMNNSWCGNGTVALAAPAIAALGTVPPRGRNTYHATGSEQLPLDGIVSAEIDLAAVAPAESMGIAAAYPAAAVAHALGYLASIESSVFSGSYALSIAGGTAVTRSTWEDGGTINSEGVQPAEGEGEFGIGFYHYYHGPPHPEQCRWGGVDFYDIDQFGNPDPDGSFFWSDPRSFQYIIGEMEDTYQEVPSSAYTSSGAWIPPQDDYLPPMAEGVGGTVTAQAEEIEGPLHICALYAMVDFILPSMTGGPGILSTGLALPGFRGYRTRVVGT